MRAILINPWDQTISEVDHNGDYRDIYTKLSVPQRKVDSFDVVTINDRGDVIYVDGEGFLFPNIPVWYWTDYSGPLCGNGLILGSDECGETVPAKISLLAVQGRVLWSPKVSEGRLRGAGQISENTYTLGTPVLKDKDQ